MRTRAIIFDLDGTLVDSLPGIEHSVDCSLQECNLPGRTISLRPLIGPPIRVILKTLVSDASERQIADLEKSFRSSYDSDGWRKTALCGHALETLCELKQTGFELFLATNKPATPTRAILRELAIEDFFSAVFCRDSRTPPFRSKGEMLLQITSQFDLDCEECLYVGDSPEDERAAEEAGMPIAIVTHGYGDREESVMQPSCPRLANLSEVSNLVGKMEVA